MVVQARGHEAQHLSFSRRQRTIAGTGRAAAARIGRTGAALVGGIDGLLQGQAETDAAYFMAAGGMARDGTRALQVHATLLKAYRWQYIVSGTLEPRFRKLLGKLAGDARMARIRAALAPLAYAVPVRAPACAMAAE